jgi:L-ribulokinase
MQIYADILGREMKVSRSAQTCALGSAIAAAVVATSAAGGYDDFASAQSAMTGVKDVVYKPDQENHAVYKKLYKLYKQLHDGFGVPGTKAEITNVMKDLLDIKEDCQG